MYLRYLKKCQQILWDSIWQRITNDDQELQELRTKIRRVLEAKLTDDSDRIRELESQLTEAEIFVSLCPKLQNSLQTDLIATRRELAGSQQLAQLAETHAIDTQEQLEIVMLDKDVAEEKAELTDTELE